METCWLLCNLVNRMPQGRRICLSYYFFIISLHGGVLLGQSCTMCIKWCDSTIKKGERTRKKKEKWLRCIKSRIKRAVVEYSLKNLWKYPKKDLEYYKMLEFSVYFHYFYNIFILISNLKKWEYWTLHCLIGLVLVCYFKTTILIYLFTYILIAQLY